MLKKVVSSNVCDENVAASQSVEQITEVHCLARQFLERSKSGRALAKKKEFPFKTACVFPIRLGVKRVTDYTELDRLMRPYTFKRDYKWVQEHFLQLFHAF